MDETVGSAGQLCTKALVATEGSTSIREVANLMRQHHIGDVVVTERGYPIGVVTDRDLVVHGLAFDVALDSLTAADLCRQTLVTIEPSADLFEIVTTMNTCAVRRLVVSEDDKLVGIITVDDVLRAIMLLVSNLAAIPERQIQLEERIDGSTPLAG